MALRTLAKPEWKAYFDHLSKNLIGERAEIEIAGLALGDRIEARWIPLIGITYEPKADVLEIAPFDGVSKRVAFSMLPKPRVDGFS